MTEDRGVATAMGASAILELPKQQSLAAFYDKLAKLENEIISGVNPRISLSAEFIERLRSTSRRDASVARRTDTASSQRIGHRDETGVVAPVADEVVVDGASLSMNNAIRAATNVVGLPVPLSDTLLPEPLHDYNTGQSRAVELDVERRRLEQRLSERVAERVTAKSKSSATKKIPNSDALDCPHSSYDVESLLEDARRVFGHVSGLMARAPRQYSARTSSFGDGYYSSKASSPWSTDASAHETEENSARVANIDQHAREQIGQPMEVDPSVRLQHNDHNDEEMDLEMEMDIDDDEVSLEKAGTIHSISSGEAYSPEPYQPPSPEIHDQIQDTNLRPQKHPISRFDPNRDESYSPPSANGLELVSEQGGASGQAHMSSQTVHRPDGNSRLSNHQDTRALSDNVETMQRNRSESYSPSLPDVTDGTSVMNHQRGSRPLNLPANNTLPLLTSTDGQPSLQQGLMAQLNQNLVPLSPFQDSHMHQLKGLAQVSAQNSLNTSGAQTPQALIDHGQDRTLLPQGPPSAQTNNRRKSRKEKRARPVPNTRLPEPSAKRRRAAPPDAGPFEPHSPSQPLPKRVASVEPYIKSEPITPPPLSTRRDSEREGNRQRVVQYSDGRVEIEPYQPASDPIPDSRSRRVDQLGSNAPPFSQRPVYFDHQQVARTRRRDPQVYDLTLDSPTTSQLLPLNRRESSDLRRVASVQYASRPRSPPPERYEPQYVRAAGASAGQQGSYFVMDSTRDVPPRAMYEQPSGMQRVQYADFDPSDVYIRRSVPPPRQKIVIDEDGNEYFAVLRNVAAVPEARGFREIDHEVDRPTSYARLPSRAVSVYDRPQTSRPPPRLIDLSDDDGRGLMPPPLTHVPIAPRRQPIEVFNSGPRRMIEYQQQPEHLLRPSSSLPTIGQRHTSLHPQYEMRRMPVEDQRNYAAPMEDVYLTRQPEHMFRREPPSRTGARALSSVQDPMIYEDERNSVPVYDTGRPRYSML